MLYIFHIACLTFVQVSWSVYWTQTPSRVIVSGIENLFALAVWNMSSIVLHFVLRVKLYLDKLINICWRKDTSKDSFEMFWTTNRLITFSPENRRHKYNRKINTEYTSEHLQYVKNHQAKSLTHCHLMEVYDIESIVGYYH